jgi:hypothetical protein
MIYSNLPHFQFISSAQCHLCQHEQCATMVINMNIAVVDYLVGASAYLRLLPVKPKRITVSTGIYTRQEIVISKVQLPTE